MHFDLSERLLRLQAALDAGDDFLLLFGRQLGDLGRGRDRDLAGLYGCD